jgi:hypothetical protein
MFICLCQLSDVFMHCIKVQTTWHITEKWLVKSSAGFFFIDITESLMKPISSNFLCL